ncbi:MAG: SpoIID/LytB domain-containing protein [Firmicutes bacterium]|nr:SpoIID/LytB domain-containing protein [Bacillota bacterium]
MRRRLLLLAIIAMTLALCGCRLFRRSAPQPPQVQKAEIPEAIAGEEGQEPQLRVYIAEEDRIVTMNFEDYVMGVVAAEMDPEWPAAALAAQAIQARTFALQKIAEQGTLPGRDAHASTNVEEFQAYDASRINGNVRKAVEDTRGVAAVYQGEFVRSWFHAYCGGITATPSAGLNYQGEDPPYLKPVENPCRQYVDEDQEFWSATFSKARVRSAVQSIVKRDPGNFQSIQIVAEENGRAVTFKVGDVEVPAPELRLALGSTEMRSAWVDPPQVSGSTVKFTGRGYGHGVGLCQWGAKGWAEEGRSAEEIVKSFFPGVSLQKLWD